MLTRQTIILGLCFLTFLLIEAYPTVEQNGHFGRQGRQEDEDDPPPASTRSPYDFGSHVAQIITGAFTGNIDSIIKGSFGFIEDPNVNKLSHNTWETLKGNPTETPPWQTTSSTAASRTERPATTEAVFEEPPPPPPKRRQPPSQPAVVSAAAEPESIAPASSPGISSSYLSSPDVYDPYSPGSPFYPTRAPVRTTRATHATLAPLSVIEGAGQTEAEPEESSTVRTSTEPDDDDGDEAEGLSAEVGEATTKASTAAVIQTSTSGPEKTTKENSEVTTEDDDDDQFNPETFFGFA